MSCTACAIRRCAASRPRAGSYVETRTGPRSPTPHFVVARRFRRFARRRKIGPSTRSTNAAPSGAPPRPPSGSPDAPVLWPSPCGDAPGTTTCSRARARAPLRRRPRRYGGAGECSPRCWAGGSGAIARESHRRARDGVCSTVCRPLAKRSADRDAVGARGAGAPARTDPGVCDEPGAAGSIEGHGEGRASVQSPAAVALPSPRRAARGGSAPGRGAAPRGGPRAPGRSNSRAMDSGDIGRKLRICSAVSGSCGVRPCGRRGSMWEQIRRLPGRGAGAEGRHARGSSSASRSG